MPVFLKPDRYVLFAHVPKTGGTSVERHFRRDGWRLEMRDQQVGRGTMNWARRCSPQHLHASPLSELLVLERMTLSFMVVRDPLDRFRSEYVMRRGGTGRGDAPAVEAWAADVFGRYAQNPYLLDNHLRPQHEFVLPGTRVYRLEEGLETMLADLNQAFELGLPPDIGHQQSGSGRHGMASRDVEISQSLEERLRDFYASDYDRFGYR